MPKFKFALFVFLLVTLMQSSSLAQDTIRITNGEWPPYQSKDLKYHGLASRIVKEAFLLEGVKVEYGFFPWTRAKKLVEVGKWNASMIWSKSPEREKDFDFSDPVVNSDSVFFHLKSYKFDWNSFADIAGIPVGATKDYNYGEGFAQAEKSKLIQVRRLPKDELNYKRMLDGKIKLFPNDANVGYDMLQKKFKKKAHLFTHHPKPLFSATMHMILSKKIEDNKRFVKLFNQGLKKLKQSRRYHE